MYEDKHVYKRSNSQTEFDFLSGMGQNPPDFNQPNNYLGNTNFFENDFMMPPSAVIPHTHMGNLQPMDKNY